VHFKSKDKNRLFVCFDFDVRFNAYFCICLESMCINHSNYAVMAILLTSNVLFGSITLSNKLYYVLLLNVLHMLGVFSRPTLR